MRHIKVTECRVADGAMQDFVNAVQQWERAAMAHEAAPIHHAVLLDPNDPSRVISITQFDSPEKAAEFAASGLMATFMEGVVQCSVGTATSNEYELFYATGAGGPRAVFGEVPEG
jgi:hypothetical protein